MSNGHPKKRGRKKKVSARPGKAFVGGYVDERIHDDLKAEAAGQPGGPRSMNWLVEKILSEGVKHLKAERALPKAA